MTAVPAGRYGPEPTARTRLWRRVGLAALILAALAIVAWIGSGVLRDPVQWRDVGFHVNDAASIDVTFEVTKDPDTAVQCTIEALSLSYAQVGLGEVAIGPSETRTQRVTVTIPTSEEATTGVVRGCEVID